MTRATVILLIFILLFGATSASFAEPFPHSKLFKSTRELVARARVRGEHNFAVIIAAAPGANERVASAIKAAGGHVERRVDAVDYIRASVPLAKLEAIADLPSVETIDADASTTYLRLNPAPLTGVSATSSPAPRRTAADMAPLLHPYLPGRDIGTLELRAVHPTFDGRGVTVALIDGTPDFFLPELQNAKMLDGSDAPKFVDIETSTDPKTEDTRYSPWIFMNSIVRTSGGTIVFDGLHYAAPHDGDFRIGFIRNTVIFSDLVDRRAKPQPKENARLYAVLWDERSNLVWVDTNNDHNFADKAPLTNYRVHHDSSTFASNSEDPDARHTIGFVVQIDRAEHAIAVLLGDGSHGTGAAGSAVGAGGAGGKFDGIAPGAQLVSIEPNYDSHGLIEAAIQAVQDPRVDMVCLESTSADSYGFKDGRYTQSVIFERLTRHYGKSIFQPGGNESGLSEIEEASVPPEVFSVGWYQNKESFLIDFGLDVAHRDNIGFGSSFGPGNNGAFKPTILAPSGYVSLDLGYEASDFQLKGVFNLPPGYQMFSGTSQATPTAMGAVAVLLSAARQSGLSPTPQQLMYAVQSTARFLPDVPAYQQGAGLIQVDRAYAELMRLGSQRPDTIELHAPVQTIVSRYLATPNEGVGLYEREGWTAGMHGVRDLLLTRTSGPAGAKSYRITLDGNDGTFTLPSSIALARNVPASLRVAIAPSAPGVHSAVLSLVDDGKHNIVLRSYLCIVAADQLTLANHYIVSHHILVPRAARSSVFVHVREGTQALRLDLQIHHDGLILQSFLPDSTQGDIPADYFLGNSLINPGTTTFVYPHPEPGVWEFLFEDFGDLFARDPMQGHPARPIPLQVSVSAIRVRAGGDGAGLSVRSELTPVPEAAYSLDVASFAEHAGLIQRGQQVVYDVVVPRGATRVGAIVEAADPRDDIGLYLFDCTAKCVLRYRTEHYDGPNEAFFDSPAPGKWRIVIDGYAARGQGARFHYVDYVASPRADVRPQPGRHVGPLFSLSLLANDFSMYNNGDDDPGPVKTRTGPNSTTATAFPLLP